MYTTGAALFIWRHSTAILIEQHLDLGVDMTRFTSKLGEGYFVCLLFQMINPTSAPQWEFEASGNLHWGSMCSGSFASRPFGLPGRNRDWDALDGLEDEHGPCSLYERDNAVVTSTKEL
jgi:hypothetical protein